MTHLEPTQTGQALVSIVVPVFNESAGIREFYDQLVSTLVQLPVDREIIFIDDGSTDRTAEIIAAIAKEDPRVGGVSLSRNFGHQAALTAGLNLARGNAVISMDGDLQHPPSLIPVLIEKWTQGHKIVNTIRQDTGDQSFLKRWSSRLYYRVLNWISEVPIPSGAADFRLLDRQVVDTLRELKEHDRFLRGLISWVGFSSTSVPFQPAKRRTGKTKYSLVKMVRLAIDGILSFSAAPLRLLLIGGLFICALSLVYASYSLYAHFFENTTVRGWTSLLVSVLFLGGVQLIGMGLLGEYLMHIYWETKGRPLYIVRQSYGASVPRANKN